MPKYRVTGIAYASKYLGEFEAMNEEEAIEIALSCDNNYLAICDKCNDDFELSDSSCAEAIAELVEEK